MKNIFGLAMLFLGVGGLALAGLSVPEVDPSSGVAALALLSGGLLVLRARRKK